MFSFYLITAIVYSLKPVVHDELALAYNADTSQSLKVALVNEAFEVLDEDHDGKLSAEEWRHFLEGSAEISYGGVTPEMLKLTETYRYPVLEVTDDMTPDQVEAVCNLGNQLENLDLVEETKRYANDTSLVLKDALEDIRRSLVQELNLVQFQSFLEKATVMTWSKQLTIPEECKQLAVTGRRRTFILGSLIIPISVIAAINGCHPFQNCWDNPGCKCSNYEQRYQCRCAFGTPCPCMVSSSGSSSSGSSRRPQTPSVRPEIIKRRERRSARM